MKKTEVVVEALPAQAADKKAPVTFELDKDEEQLLEEFGVLMAAEYNYVMLGS